MVKYNQSPTRGQQSVKFRAKPLKGPSFEIADFADASDVPILYNDNQNTRQKSNSHSSEILTTAELITAVGQIWDCASRSLACFQHKATSNRSDISQKDESCYLVGNDRIGVLNFIDGGYLHVDLKSSIYFSCVVQQSLEFMRLTRKVHYIPSEDNFIQYFFGRKWHESSIGYDMWSKERSLANVGILYNLVNGYIWMSQPRPELPLSVSRKPKKIIESFASKAAGNDCCVSGNEVNSSSNEENVSLGSCTNTPNLTELPSGVSGNVIMNMKTSVSSLYTDDLLQGVQDTHHATSMFTASTLDYNVSTSAPDCTGERYQLNIEAYDLLENETGQCEKFNTQCELQSDSCSSVTDKPRPFLAKQEHAVSGALAGIFVSLCLHPLDTIKTVIQSCQAGQKSISYIGQSIVSERGLLGLYRGITSNITTSAPISAIYTFTYESVKGFLLPSLAKEYHSVAHCTAGACASIATSFVFTPSEHIKQQMQVNSKYLNSWSAVFRIIETGGFRSLYAGWGAVLSRNIPHSIIKFYTYESLKQMFMSSQPPNKQPNTLQTLLCGGLAGSTAALFSTPFDVVKTRLQTQMPGSVRRHHSILNALQDIREQEGVKGLYRGLIPRLVMYMSQGALFFASYEFFKSLISLELRQRQPDMLQHKQGNDDDPLLSL